MNFIKDCANVYYNNNSSLQFIIHVEYTKLFATLVTL